MSEAKFTSAASFLGGPDLQDMFNALHESWGAVDLAEAWDNPDGGARPTMMRRTDGQALMYPGERHIVMGPPEAGKSWLALMVCLESIADGGVAVYIDLEDSPRRMAERLKALGADRQVLDRFRYLRPEYPLSGDPKPGDVARQLGGLDDVQVVVIDSTTKAMTLHGFDINDNADAAAYARLLPDVIAAAGVAVLQIDHVTKARTGGRYPLGAGHKAAGVDTTYALDNKQRFGRGVAGYSVLSIGKDRAGHLHELAAGGTLATLHAEPHPDGPDRLDLRLEPPGGTRLTSSGNSVEQAVTDALTGGPLGSDALRKAVRGRGGASNDTIDQTVKAMVKDERVKVRKEGNKKLHTLADTTRSAR